MKFNEKWTLIAGLRYDHFKEYNQETNYSYSDHDVTPRVALTYQPKDDLSFYINYSESFNPTSANNQEDVAGDSTLKPESGKQTEVGMKTFWLNGKIMNTFAVYQINKENVVVTNPNDTGIGDGIAALVNIGEAESNGFETTLVGDISDNWTVTANYAYNDIYVIQPPVEVAITNSFDGKHFTNAPRHQAGLWNRFNLEVIDSSIAFGLNYVSEQRSLAGQKVKPFTVFDLSWTTRWDDLLLSVNVDNLFDKEYAVSGFSERNGHFPGSPRKIIAQFTYQL